RANKQLPPDPGQSFVHGMGVLARLPGDTVSTIGLLDPDPMSGSVMLYAGWQVDGIPYGAPNNGFAPVPRQLLRAIVYDPRVAAYSFWRKSRGLNALAELGVRHIEMPATPERVWQSIRAAAATKG